MLSQDQNERLTRVGRGTPMGDLMRMYWQPIAAVSQLKGRDTLPVKLLGENLVLYKDLSGTYGLIDQRCPHRSMSMVYGIPEKCGLRCPYHGWIFNEKGACTEMPYEETEDPSGAFKAKVTTPAYPVQVMGGMIFAYLGKLPAPVLPKWDLYVDKAMREVTYAVVPCNWLQIMENSLDPVHVEWLHRYWRNYTLGKLGRESERVFPHQEHEKIAFTEFPYGIVKRRVIKGLTEDDDDWKIGHPILFPNYLRTGKTFQIRVPIDDHNTAYWWYRAFTADTGIEIRPQADEDIPYQSAPVPLLDPNGMPQWDIIDNNSGQDIVAWITQGHVTDRTVENLGRSDKGITMYRRLLEISLQQMEQGTDPMNVFRKDPGRIEIETERVFWGRKVDIVGGDRTGHTLKYSQILKEVDEGKIARTAAE